MLGVAGVSNDATMLQAISGLKRKGDSELPFYESYPPSRDMPFGLAGARHEQSATNLVHAPWSAIPLAFACRLHTHSHGLAAILPCICILPLILSPSTVVLPLKSHFHRVRLRTYHIVAHRIAVDFGADLALFLGHAFHLRSRVEFRLLNAIIVGFGARTHHAAFGRGCCFLHSRCIKSLCILS